MPAPSQRSALVVLFAILALAFAGVAFAAARQGVWVIGLSAAILGFWMAGMALRALRAR